MEVIHDKLTTIGGRKEDYDTESNVLLTLLPGDSIWKKIFPAMPTYRTEPNVVCTHTHLVVAGGGEYSVEILDTETLQWVTSCSLPLSRYICGLTVCAGYLYLSQGMSLHTCSMDELLQWKPRSRSIWTKLPDMYVSSASLITLREHVLAICDHDHGGLTKAAIHCYKSTTNSWSVIGQFPTPVYNVLIAVLPGNKLVVVGALGVGRVVGREVYIGL